jgi:tRNA (guanine37-N1)-methyltransferase
MKIDILTLFPNMFDGFLSESIIKIAIEKKLVDINIHNIRDYSKDPHKKVDDEPYGGGAGMVLMCQPIFDAVDKLQQKRTKVILMTPQGVPFNQKLAYNLSKEEHLLMICGHYEGFDERIRSLCDMEISIGDYVLTGGELPSMVITDSVVRLIDGVIEDESHLNDSFNDDLLDYPNYTKPREYEGLKVPDVLVSGHHKNIEKYREEEKIKRTEERRPDLLENKYYSFFIEKKTKFKQGTISSKIEGYSFNPKNDAKRTDVINVTKIEIIEPAFVRNVARKSIERKLQKLLKTVMLIAEEGSESENSDLILGEAERLKSILNNYSKILEKDYIEAIEKRIDFIVKEIKIQKIMSNPVEEKEKSGRSR